MFAKYRIAIPKVDNFGNPLRNIAGAAHTYLFYGPLHIERSWTEKGIQGNWRDDPDETYDHLIAVAQESPQMDSSMKQLAVHIGEACNQWGIFVLKEGKNGPTPWTVRNPNYRPNEPADPVALEQADKEQDVIRI